MVKNVAISIPNEGVTRPESYDNHLVLAHRLGVWQERIKNENRPIQYQFNYYTAGRMLTPVAREELTKNALACDMDYVIMYDDDMILPPDVFERLLEDIEKKPEIDLLAPLAFMRSAPHYAVIYNFEEGYDKDHHKDYFRNNPIRNYPRNTIVECDAVGFGMVVIKLDFVRKNMKAPYFFSTAATGEDIWFCWQVKKAGGRIFMDTSVKLGHIGHPNIIDEEFHDKWNKENGKDYSKDLQHKYLSL